MTHDTIPAENDDTSNMGLRDLIIEQRTDLKWIKQKLGSVCKDVKSHESRIGALEQMDAKFEGKDIAKSDNKALTIAIIALLISGVATIWNIVGGM